MGTRAAARDPRRWRKVAWEQRPEPQKVAQKCCLLGTSCWVVVGGAGRASELDWNVCGLGCAFHRCWPLPSSSDQLLLKLDQGLTRQAW